MNSRWQTAITDLHFRNVINDVTKGICLIMKTVADESRIFRLLKRSCFVSRNSQSKFVVLRQALVLLGDLVMKQSLRVLAIAFASVWIILATETAFGAQSGGKEANEKSSERTHEARGIGQEIHDTIKDILDNNDHKGIGHEIHDDVHDIIVSKS